MSARGNVTEVLGPDVILSEAHFAERRIWASRAMQACPEQA